MSSFPDRMRRASIVGLPAEHRHAVAVAELPPHHRDPFDRLLVAQAMVERLPLITADPSMDPYAVELVRVAADPGTQ